ncbi:hypothetical protein KAFR_0F01880 [Kazachstania africana CBS 2517]|uniref:F-box domain-containing protein n=1 Tax=Kazachstania africana (strain ATCC 22294 / BCRC 22015 / CBS 2517 / CECT 1963 / NBRC 1671 / NRRL Y-8276) TaxID=1071382 RepID=H2AWN5_KAZAF|nr:hypothetical protein KAFR_0F01880 [Kazachstania africana CBS 2517]CCF58785.1 hypothetical protein KAFR_0F01880 [Kazachstania africana CBS 2517]
MFHKPNFPLESLPDELIKEILSNLNQCDRLTSALVNKRFNKIATKLIYRRIYLNDSNVVRSDFMNIAINWTLLHIPSFISEEESREIANEKLLKLIDTLQTNVLTIESVEWIRINWDLDPNLQRNILNLLCNNAKSLKRLENITDPQCNDIIAKGKISQANVTSFDMAPPNALPESVVNETYIPNLVTYLNQRISNNLSHMTLFMDPIKLFNYLYHLKEKLTIVDLKLHWRREFFQGEYFTMDKLRNPPFRKLNEIFDIRTLKTLTIISWNESLIDREIEMLKEFKEFIYLEDLSLISIKQDIDILIELFNKLTNLKRLKMDFLEDFVPETTSSQIFLSILLNCKKLQFIDIRFEGIDLPMINLIENKFEVTQKCFCESCNNTFDKIIRNKIFLFPNDYYLTDLHDIATKDILKMMRYLSLFPYSKACDCYPSVRTQPMNIEQFVKKMNENLLIYRQNRSQLLPFNSSEDPNIVDSRNLTFEQKLLRLPHDPITRDDVVNIYHALLHHFKTTYYTFLKGFSDLRFLMLNDIPTVVVEENNERIFHPVFYHYNYVSNLYGWSKRDKQQNSGESSKSRSSDNDTVSKRVTVI